MKIGIYSPDLNICGGGEKYIGKIAEVLSGRNDVEFLVFEKPDLKQLKDRLNLDLTGVGIRTLKIPYLLKKVYYLEELAKIGIVSQSTKKYDLFINQENNTLIPSYSRKSVYISQLPVRKLGKQALLRMIDNFWADVHLKTYEKIVTYSDYNKKYIEKWPGIKEVKVLFPPIDTEEFRPLKKENIILSVGRFFVDGHSKGQLEMIKVFQELYQENEKLENWEYHLLGGIGESVGDKQYLKKCQAKAQGYPICFHINAPFEVLKRLYGKAKIFWHATGLGERESEHPELMEHFGMSSAEAMSAGCVPVVINKGGQIEVVRDRQDGFLWNNTKELKDYTTQLINNKILWQKMSNSSIKRAQKFAMARFSRGAREIFNL